MALGSIESVVAFDYFIVTVDHLWVAKDETIPAERLAEIESVAGMESFTPAASIPWVASDEMETGEVEADPPSLESAAAMVKMGVDVLNPTYTWDADSSLGAPMFRLPLVKLLSSDITEY